MDLQMPEMDGFEASRIIREEKSAAGLPIVALTASAMHDVSGKIYDAGMNDFVTKPFHPDDLYQKIARYTSLSESGPVPAADLAITALNPVSVDILDMGGLVEVAGAGTDFLEEMIRMHIDMFQGFAEEYRQVMEQRDPKGLKFIFHRVKTSCTMLRISLLEEEYSVARKILANTNSSKTEIEAATERVHSICSEICYRLHEEYKALTIK
jgi:response regulator RpfG family c-di-GMP phosphodiesterase